MPDTAGQIPLQPEWRVYRLRQRGAVGIEGDGHLPQCTSSQGIYRKPVDTVRRNRAAVALAIPVHIARANGIRKSIRPALYHTVIFIQQLYDDRLGLRQVEVELGGILVVVTVGRDKLLRDIEIAVLNRNLPAGLVVIFTGFANAVGRIDNDAQVLASLLVESDRNTGDGGTVASHLGQCGIADPHALFVQLHQHISCRLVALVHHGNIDTDGVVQLGEYRVEYDIGTTHRQVRQALHRQLREGAVVGQVKLSDIALWIHHHVNHPVCITGDFRPYEINGHTFPAGDLRQYLAAQQHATVSGIAIVEGHFHRSRVLGAGIAHDGRDRNPGPLESRRRTELDILVTGHQVGALLDAGVEGERDAVVVLVQLGHIIGRVDFHHQAQRADGVDAPGNRLRRRLPGLDGEAGGIDFLYAAAGIHQVAHRKRGGILSAAVVDAHREFRIGIDKWTRRSHGNIFGKHGQVQRRYGRNRNHRLVVALFRLGKFIGRVDHQSVGLGTRRIDGTDQADGGGRTPIHCQLLAVLQLAGTRLAAPQLYGDSGRRLAAHVA